LSESLTRFNGLSGDEAVRRLRACCASKTWASKVAARRPYADLVALMETADVVWHELAPADWLEAFAAHPRLGESGGHSPHSSEREQGRIMGAGDETLAMLAEENRRYEARFGHVFLISAAGRSAADVLAAMRQRMNNDPATEVQVAAEEQRKITRLRLESMLQA
jgi:OHCU decarboxylase